MIIVTITVYHGLVNVKSQIKKMIENEKKNNAPKYDGRQIKYINNR